MFRLGLILGSILICFGQIDCVLNPKVVCYYENWFVWRNGDGKMTVEDVDSSLCTHIVYAYLGVSTANEIFLPDSYLMIDKKDLVHFSDRKGHAKALAAIGGWSLSGNFETMVSSSIARDHFVNAVLDFLKSYNFDGITLDWSRAGWSDYAMDDFAKLLESLHQAFAGKYVLGITVAARPIGFKVKLIDKFVDFLDVQTYDYHGSWEKEVGHQAPLDWQYSILREWEDAGATINKLLMTIPLFAHTWLLESTSHTEPGASASHPGRPGPFSQAEGKLNYNELCLEIKHDPSGWQLKVDHNASDAAYAIHENTWVTFETPTTAKDKAHNVTTEGYGGVVVQALPAEDFRGLCGVKYPLLKAINEGLNKDDIKDRTPHPHHSTTPATVTSDPKSICHKAGKFRDLHDCQIYYKCIEFVHGVFKEEKLSCAKDEAFDEKDEKCKDRAQVAGCH
jgi:chitinase